MTRFSRFAVYRNSRDSRGEIPYLVDVQADWVTTGSRVVVPLIPAKIYGPPVSRLNPLFNIDGVSHVLATSDIAAIDANELQRSVHDFSEHRQTIVAALDFLFQGY